MRTPSASADAEQADTLRTVAVRGGSGDGPAAALARFLVTDNAATRGGESSAHRTIASAGEAKPGLAGVPSFGGAAEARGIARPGDTVADILATAVTKGDSIEGASKVLSSGGSSGRHQVVLQLDPPELGQLRMEIRMHQASMALRVNVESASVAQLVESRLPELKEALATHGIRIEQADVQIRVADPQTAGGRQEEPRSGHDSTHQGLAQHSGDWSGGGSSGAPGGGSAPEGDRTMNWHGSADGAGATAAPALERESMLTQTMVDVTA